MFDEHRSLRGAVVPPRLSLSVLDLVPRRSGATLADALAVSSATARAADESGFTRYWLAEHHSVEAYATTSPAVIAAALASRTERIRVGSGGVLLPNHSPLIVAEQFAALEALHPGRVDLGIGRGPGGSPVTSYLIGQDARRAQPEQFEQDLEILSRLLSPEGLTLEAGGDRHQVIAGSGASTFPPIWLLGSSEHSARLAARRGMPYVFDHHFKLDGTREAFDIYRAEFQPSASTPEPKVILTATVVTDTTTDAAVRATMPALHEMALQRTGAGNLAALLAPEAARDAVRTPQQERFIEMMLGQWVIENAAGAGKRLRAMADEFDADEIMINPLSADAAVRVRTIELLARELLEDRNDRTKPTTEQNMTETRIDIDWADIPAGTFTMGSPPAEEERWEIEHPHQVSLSAFQMSRYSVTFDQYDAYCDATGRPKPDDAGWGRGSRPVVNVTWDEAVAFADWVGDGARLPAEAEWEYACRAGTTTAFHSGNRLDPGLANFEHRTFAGRTLPVGSFPPNAWGLYDMHGNSWDWCSDWFDTDYYLHSPETDPQGPTTGTTHVIRGGSWFNFEVHCRSAFRDTPPFDRDFREMRIGFRLARTAA
jgi:luciferase family oxidoreductase group 1